MNFKKLVQIILTAATYTLVGTILLHNGFVESLLIGVVIGSVAVLLDMTINKKLLKKIDSDVAYIEKLKQLKR